MAIQDSLRVVSQYIAATVDVVHNLVSAQKHSCPFQYDSVYAFGKVKPLAAFSMNDVNDGDSDDDDDDVNDDEKVFDDGKDPFGSIVDKLKANELPFIELPGKAGTARFVDGFKKFRDEHMTDQKDYPQNERFLSVVDRRNNGESVLFYAPPENCRSLPHPVNPFRFFENARACVVPDEDYVERLKEKDVANQKSPKTVTTLSIKRGIVLSFHCLSTEEIRCYLYMNGQGMRFMPEDICHLLPIFFDPEFEDNKKWATSKEAKNLVREMDKKLRDDGFKAFFNSFKHQKAPQ